MDITKIQLSWRDHTKWYSENFLELINIDAWKIITEHNNISPRRPDIDKFCPTMEGCEKGLHVLCLHNQNIYGRHGPSCNFSAEIELLDIHKNKIVNYINSIRRKAALGAEVSLRRGYGIRMVSWDKYLADFAQIWADQCVFRTDNACHATPDFPNPAQIITGIRYSFPEMKKYERRFMNNNSSSKSRPKTDKDNPQTRARKFVGRTIMMVIEGWYKSKNNTAIKNMYYDQLVYHRVTHIGCGISVFISYEHQKKKKIPPVLNKRKSTLSKYMMLVCNLSHKLPSGQHPFDVVKNTSQGWSKRCGCPPDTVEHEETCLCYEPRYQDENRVKDCLYGDCKPNVVLLPIVTVENAAPSRNEQRSQRISSGGENYFSFINKPAGVSLVEKEAQLLQRDQNQFQDFTRKLVDEPKVIVMERNNINQVLNEKSFHEDVLMKKPQGNRLTGNDETETGAKPYNKSNNVPHEIVPILKDVTHRKNFEITHSVLDAYMANKRNNGQIFHKLEKNGKVKESRHLSDYEGPDLQFQNNAEKDLRLLNRRKGSLALPNEPQTENTAKVAHKSKVKYFAQYPVIGSNHRNKMKDKSMHVKLSVNFDENESRKEYSKITKHNFNHINPAESSAATDPNITHNHDHNLLKLLDNLESEVHHLNLSKSEKDILHNKLKKIYNDLGSQPRDKKHMQNDRDIVDTRPEKEINEHTRPRPIIAPKENNLHHKHSMINQDADDADVLSVSRRRYYQEKLEKLAQKLLKRRRQHNHENARYVRPTLQDNYAHRYPVYVPPSMPLRPFGNPVVYAPERARAMHGYDFF